jgi:hypothetical protein
LVADPLAVSIRIVFPAENAGLRKVGKKKIMELVNVVRGRPRLVSMLIQAMDGDDAAKSQSMGLNMGWLLIR